MRRLTGLSGQSMLLAFAAALGSGAPAHANPSHTPHDDTISIEITATIAEQCGISPGANATRAEGNLQQAETLTFNFDVNCNTPFRIGVSSEHGGLRLSTAPNDQGAVAPDGFSIMKPYQVGLRLDTDSGLLDGGTCRSDQLTSHEGGCNFYGARPGRGLSSGHRTAINRIGTLAVSWAAEDDSSGPRRAAGRYEDTLTVVIGPRT